MAAKLIDIQYRVPLWHESLPFIALWSEKSNCTAVAKWFFYQIGLLEEALSYSSWIHDYEIKVYKTEAYMERCLKAVNSGMPIIKFVRNPYARAFSGYLELCRAHPDVPDHWSIPLRREAIAHLMGTDSEIEYAFSFHQYLEWLQTKKPEALDLHLAPQFRAHEAELDIEPFHIEQGASGFAVLEHRYSLKPSRDVPGIFQSDHYHRKVPVGTKTSVAMCHVGIPLQRSQDFLLFEPNTASVSRDVCGAVIRKLFDRDFGSYGYEPFPVEGEHPEH